VTNEETPIFERGDVVYGDDPLKGEEDARPWLIFSNHEGRQFYREQYIAVIAGRWCRIRNKRVVIQIPRRRHQQAIDRCP